MILPEVLFVENLRAPSILYRAYCRGITIAHFPKTDQCVHAKYTRFSVFKPKLLGGAVKNAIRPVKNRQFLDQNGDFMIVGGVVGVTTVIRRKRRILGVDGPISAHFPPN